MPGSPVAAGVLVSYLVCTCVLSVAIPIELTHKDSGYNIACHHHKSACKLESSFVDSSLQAQHPFGFLILVYVAIHDHSAV